MHKCYTLAHMYWITITHGRSRPCSKAQREWVNHQYAWLTLYVLCKLNHALYVRCYGNTYIVSCSKPLPTYVCIRTLKHANQRVSLKGLPLASSFSSPMALIMISPEPRQCEVWGMESLVFAMMSFGSTTLEG